MPLLKPPQIHPCYFAYLLGINQAKEYLQELCLLTPEGAWLLGIYLAFPQLLHGF
jgi:hypothetical protein